MPVRLSGTSVLRASELKAIGAVEIRPYPAEPPDVSELQSPEVTRVIRRQGGEDFRRTVLALKRVVRRSNVFREAVALVFAADKGDEVQIAFAIDGKLSDAYERAFAERGGPRKMGFIKALGEGDARKKLERFVGRDILAACPDRSEMTAARTAEAEAEEEVRSIRPAAERGGRNNAAVGALKVAMEKLSVARHNIESKPIRPLACFEQKVLLEEALNNASRSLIISSAGVQPTIVNGPAIREIDRLIESRVDIVIETELAPRADPRGNFDPLYELTKRSNNSLLRLVKGPHRGLYFLIQDGDLAVISSRPFLGEVARRSGFVKLSGVVARGSGYIRAIQEMWLASSKRATRLA